MPSHKRTPIFVLIVALIAGPLACSRTASDSAFARIDPKDVTSITVSMHDVDKNREVTPTLATEPERFGALLQTINSAVKREDHKCASEGEITILRNDGSRVTVDYLGGHDPGFREFRYRGNLYRVPAQAWINAMKEIGVAIRD